MAIAVSTNSTATPRKSVSFAGVSVSTPGVADVVEAVAIVKDPFVTTVPETPKFSTTVNEYVGEVIIQYATSRDVWSTG